MYDAEQRATEIEAVISKLSETLSQVQVTNGFSEILDSEQLGEVECAALRLSAAVAHFLADAIKYLDNQGPGLH